MVTEVVGGKVTAPVVDVDGAVVATTTTVAATLPYRMRESVAFFRLFSY